MGIEGNGGERRVENGAQDTNAYEVSFGFVGDFALKMDSNQRIAIPAKFKAVLESKYPAKAGEEGVRVALVPEDGKVKVFPMPVWEAFEREMHSKFSQFDPMADEYFTFLYGNMAFSTLDAQNRVRITPSMSEIAELSKEVCVVGKRDQMEIWDAKKWAEFKQSTKKNLANVRSQMFRNSAMSQGR